MSAGYAVIPKTIEDFERLSSIYLGSEVAKKSTNARSKNDMFIILSVAAELNMTPAQGVQNISIINGRFTVWGDLLLSIVYNSGKLEYISETYEGEGGHRRAICEVKRKDGLLKDPIVQIFGVEDAKRAGLYGRSTYKQYPDRMFKMRARSFALRDGFADCLKGLIAREEAMDYPSKTKAVGKKTPPPQGGPSVSVDNIDKMQKIVKREESYGRVTEFVTLEVVESVFNKAFSEHESLRDEYSSKLDIIMKKAASTVGERLSRFLASLKTQDNTYVAFFMSLASLAANKKSIDGEKNLDIVLEELLQDKIFFGKVKNIIEGCISK